MADYRRVIRHFPAVRDYLRNRVWVQRGDVTAYAPGQKTASFSTDAFGFRHTSFGGNSLGMETVDGGGAYGLVLGSSHVFGFGLASNSETFASQLSRHLGTPCLTICYPEADSRTLHATLLRILATAARRPAFVVLFNGGDFTRFAYVGQADPLFGVPDFQKGGTDPLAMADDRQAQTLCRYTLFWAEQCARAAVSVGARFVLMDDKTFFEKAAPNAVEQDCLLGSSGGAGAARFAVHKRHVWRFHGARARFMVEALAQPAWPLDFEDYTFIDEFHYTAESLARFADLAAARLQAPGED
jgi:hypothetical protein